MSVGQNTVSPPSMFSLNVEATPEDINKSAKVLHPCFDSIAVKLRALGPAVGASASGEVRT